MTIANERGHRFDVHGGQLKDITGLIVLVGSSALPEDCWRMRYHVSATVDFMLAQDYDHFRILETLRVPTPAARRRRILRSGAGEDQHLAARRRLRDIS